jgi:dTMP kinase
MAYQGHGRGIELGIVDQMNRFAVGDCYPDLTFIMDVEPDLGLKRAGANSELDRIEKEALSFHERVRNGYLEMAKQGKRFRVVSCDREIEVIQNEIQQHVDLFLGKNLE